MVILLKWFTVPKIIQETCQVSWEVLSPVYQKSPDTEEECKSIANNFEEVWNLPLCNLGKHIAMELPKKFGSLCYNYKGLYSLVLMAICNASHCFAHVDIGHYENGNDSGVLKNSQIGKGLRIILSICHHPAKFQESKNMYLLS